MAAPSVFIAEEVDARTQLPLPSRAPHSAFMQRAVQASWLSGTSRAQGLKGPSVRAHLLPVLAGCLDGGFGAELLQLVVGHDFRADEAALEVRVDGARRLRSIDKGSLGLPDGVDAVDQPTLAHGNACLGKHSQPPLPATGPKVELNAQDPIPNRLGARWLFLGSVWGNPLSLQLASPTPACGVLPGARLAQEAVQPRALA